MGGQKTISTKKKKVVNKNSRNDADSAAQAHETEQSNQTQLVEMKRQIQQLQLELSEAREKSGTHSEESHASAQANHAPGLLVAPQGSNHSVPQVPISVGQTKPVPLDERSFLACIVRTIAAGGKTHISSTLQNKLGKMLAPIKLSVYRNLYGKLDDFVARPRRPEMFLIEGGYIQLTEAGAQELKNDVLPTCEDFAYHTPLTFLYQDGEGFTHVIDTFSEIDGKEDGIHTCLVSTEMLTKRSINEYAPHVFCPHDKFFYSAIGVPYSALVYSPQFRTLSRYTGDLGATSPENLPSLVRGIFSGVLSVQRCYGYADVSRCSLVVTACSSGVLCPSSEMKARSIVTTFKKLGSVIRESIKKWADEPGLKQLLECCEKVKNEEDCELLLYHPYFLSTEGIVLMIPTFHGKVKLYRKVKDAIDSIKFQDSWIKRVENFAKGGYEGNCYPELIQALGFRSSGEAKEGEPNEPTYRLEPVEFLRFLRNFVVHLSRSKLVKNPQLLLRMIDYVQENFLSDAYGRYVENE